MTKLFILKLPRFFVRLFAERKHAQIKKNNNFFSPSSRSLIVLALIKCDQIIVIFQIMWNHVYKMPEAFESKLEYRDLYELFQP